MVNFSSDVKIMTSVIISYHFRLKGMLLDKRMLKPLVLEGQMRTAKIMLMMDGRTVTTHPVQQVFFIRDEGKTNR